MSNQKKEIKKSMVMWTRATALKAFQTRRELKPEEIKSNARKLFIVRGSGTIIDVKDSIGRYVRSADGSGKILQKKIFSTDYLSPSGLKNPMTGQYLKTALKAEGQGKLQEAADNYNAYLNAVTLSFSVLSSSKYFDTLSAGDQISANLLQIETTNGVLITIDSKSVSIKEVTASPLTKINPFESPDLNQETSETLLDRTILIDRKKVNELMDLA